MILAKLENRNTMLSQSIQSIEHLIKSKLKSLGYFHFEIKGTMDNSFTLVADGNMRSIFLCVNVLEASETQKTLSTTEINNIKKTAEELHKEPWAAYVKVNESESEMVDSLEWKDLSKY